MDQQDLSSIDSSEFARCLFEESNDALFVFNPEDLAVIDVNPAAQKLTGASRPELRGRRISELFDADHARLLGELLDSCHATQIFHSRESYRLLCSGNKSLEVNLTVSRLHTKPHPLGLIGVRDISKRRQLEKQLRETQTQLEATLEQQTDRLESRETLLRELVNDVDAIVWEAEIPSWQFTFVSRRAEDILGYPISQWLEEPDFWINLIHEDDREWCVKLCLECTERGEDHAFEYRAIASDGSIVWLNDIVHVVTNEDGVPTQLRGVVFDISHRKNADTLLEQNRIQLADQLAEVELLYRSAHVGLCLLDTDLRFIRINEMLAEINGRSVQDHLGKHIRDVLPDIADQIEPIYRRVIESGEPATNLQVNRPDPDSPNDLLYYLASYHPLQDATGSVVGISTVVHDITIQKRIEAALRESEEKFRVLTEQNTSLILMIRDDRILYGNSTVAACIGHSLSDLLNRSVYEIVDVDSHKQLASILSAKRGQDEPSEIKLIAKSGEDVWIDVSARDIELDGASVALVNGMDITQRKIAEEQVRRMDAQLAHVSRLSTMGELVAGIAHEINQPLAAIANFAVACRNTVQSSGRGDEQLEDWLSSINEEAVRCGDIIRRLRAFVKKGETEKTEIDLSHVVRNSIALLESDLRNRSLSIDFDERQANATIAGNSVQIQQVIVNLLRNACDSAAGVNTPQVRVQIHEFANALRVTVEDNGAGVDESERRKIFDAFYSTKHEGMGMGLAISRSIVEAHGGKLRFEPASPVGAQFHMELPKSQS